MSVVNSMTSKNPVGKENYVQHAFHKGNLIKQMENFESCDWIRSLQTPSIFRLYPTK